jgi:UDP-glucose 4-epimerase
MRKILVTGASGFIGRALVSHLASRGFEVRAAARQTEAMPSGANIEPLTLPDLAGPVDWIALIGNADGVVHLAGVAHRDGVDETAYDRIIHQTTSELASACAAAHVRMIYVSSIGAQTGSAADHVITENDVPRPVSAYDRAKLKAEEAIRASGCDYTILRPVLVYGPGAKGNMGRLMKLASSRWPLPFASLRSRRSLLGIDNFVDAIRFCLSSDLTRSETFIVADDGPISVAEMLTLMRRAVGRAPGLFAVPESIFRPLSKIANPQLWDRIGREMVVDPGKLLAVGWRPPLDVRAGLKAMMVGLNRGG